MRPVRLLVGGLLLVFFFLFLILPLYTVVAEGLRPSFLLAAAQNPIYQQGLWNALVKAVIVTVMVILIAIPLALVTDAYDFPGKSWVHPLILLPMILPPFVGALGFQQIFGQFGALNALMGHIGLIDGTQPPDWLGSGRLGVVCLVESLHLYPILFLNVATALANVDPSLNEAAQNMGATRWTRFRRVTLPMIRPGLFAGIVLVFIWSFTELGTSLMLGYHRITPVQIFNGITEMESNPEPYSLVVLLLVISAALYLLSRLILGKSAGPMVGRAVAGSSAKRLSGWRALLPVLLLGSITGMAVLPHIGVILLSVAKNWYGTVFPSDFTLDYYAAALSHDLVVPSIIHSLTYASLATVACVAAGLAVAIITVRWKPPGWQVLDVMSMMPLAIPGIILAFGYLGMTARYDILHAWLDPIKNPLVLLVLAYAMRRLPYVVRAAVAGLEQTPVEYELAAQNLGASNTRTLSRIVVPLIAANLLAGALFAFSFSMLEVSDSLILAQKKEFFPITRAIYELASILGSGPYIACAFGVWAMTFLAATLVAASRLLGRRMGSLFRV